ncbi:trypsin-like peptidase domain-containing protein [Rosistilla oblonga]|uniref:trypsin-like peptidase domain-containing protein n=1 Tax=Rosistilla oblonga TaxID=2527990 RepID=UPI003A98644F
MRKHFSKLVSLAAFGLSASLAMSTLVAVEPKARDRATESLSANNLSSVVRQVADDVSPSIVTVYALRGPRMTAPMRWREEAKLPQPFHSPNHQHAASSNSHSADDQGSGVIIDRRGCVLTCSHVVENADAVFVRTADGRKLHAEAVICDLQSDIAIIRLESAENLSEAKLADSDDLSVGDWVVSLASPYDLQRSVSAGIISSTQRWVASSPHALIQNDAATNPGSSGGALLNLRGEVIGIIEGALTTSGAFQGIGLATPINTARDIAEQLQTKGYVERGYFGFQTQPLTPEMASLIDSSVNAGLYVKDVQRNSPANHAGLREGDVVTKFDGKPINQSFDPATLAAAAEPGKSHIMTVLREHKVVEIEMRMQLPPREVGPIQPELPPIGSFEYFDSSLGLGLSRLNTSIINELELPGDAHGALITQVAMNSDAYREGVAAGMAIARVNDTTIHDVDEYREVTSKLDREKPVLLLLQSDQGKHLVMLHMSRKENDEKGKN